MSKKKLNKSKSESIDPNGEYVIEKHADLNIIVKTKNGYIYKNLAIASLIIAKS